MTHYTTATPSEVAVGAEDGLKHRSAVTLDHVQTVERARPVANVGTLQDPKMQSVCPALAVAAGCGD